MGNKCCTASVVEAAKAGDLAKTKKLGQGSADNNAKDEYGFTALMEVAGNGHIAVVRCLAEDHVADVNAMGEYGDTALTSAASSGLVDDVRYLVEGRGADVNATDKYGYTALMWAARNGHIEVVRYLAEECGVDVNATGENGSTALMWAAGNGHIEVVRYLAEERDADVNAKKRNRETALMRAAIGGCIEVVRYLVERRGADMNTKTNEGQTVLNEAAAYGRIEVVRYLVEERGADVNATGYGGFTAMRWAALCGKVEVVRYLVEVHGADVNETGEDGDTALMEAAERGNREVVRYLAEERGADVNAKSEDGYTALMRAAEYGHIEVVRYLAEERDADVNAKTTNGYIALMMAARNGHIEVVRYLAEEHDADVNTTGEDGYTALMWAAGNGHIEVVRYLAEECGVDVNATGENGSTALIWAAANGHIEVVRYLVEEHGADVNATRKDGSTALMMATCNRHMEVVRYLVEERGAELNARIEDKFTALMMDVYKRRIKGVRYRAERGADVNATNKNGDTWLISAARNGRIDVIRCLVKCKADVNAKNVHGYTALMQAAENGHIEVVRYLATSGADVNAKNEDGDIAVMMAAENGHMGVVRYLAEECNTDVNAKNEDGDTALMMAAGNGQIEVVRYLVKCGADEDATRKYGFTAPMLAALNGQIEVVRYFVERGADVNAKNEDGDTALMKAAGNGQIEVVRYLVECGADVNATRKDGHTALMLATYNRHMEVVRYLAEERGADVNAKDKDGSTAIRFAYARRHQEIQRILTPFLPPPEPHAWATTEKNALPSDHSSSWQIPPSEIALIDFVKTGDVGGDFLAKWLDADAVVKLFIPDASHSAFADEVRLWQQLRHPNVIKMYGACAAGPHLQFFVCEYASNGSLIEYVTSTPKEERTIWKFLYQAALGLEYLHERRIVHGDLLCSNILIGSDGLAKLSNFELSGQASSAVGSMRWQAPEVMRGNPSSFASDVYSLGMCILEAATGKMPWGDNTIIFAVCSKMNWTPETSVSRDGGPKCLPDDARDLVWRMCCQDPDKRASLSSVVYELERLAIKESSNYTQPEHEPAYTFDNYKCGETKEVWMDVQKRMEKCDNGQYRQTFDELKKVRERLQDSTHHSTLLARFHTLLTEFHHTVTMPTDQARIMRLSSTRATTNSVRTFHRRIKSLWTALGESVDAAKEREARWEKQRSEQIEFFVSEVSKTYLLLKELKSAEERLAFLAFLKTEMGRQSEYTPGQLEVMKKAYEDVASKLKTDNLSELTPEWFIPWYELIFDEGDRLGVGGFGSVYRAKWLDSEVVVKQLQPNSSGGGNDTAQQKSYMSRSSENASEHMSAIPAPTDPTKKAEALAMFRREVDIWFRFSHPHVVRLFGACHVGRPFFVCEYATNGTLVSYLRKYPDQLWAKLHEAALGVQYLHARNVVHGDLKGNNIVIGSDMKAKVTDFGLSSLTSDDGKAQISAASHWVAPECFDGVNAKPTFASDIYSLGMCVVEALRVVEGARFCLPWGSLGNDVAKYHAKKGELPLKPKICEDDQWELVKRMCEFEPKKRIKISTVVDELTKLAGMKDDAKTESVSMKSVPEVISTARESLAGLQDNQGEFSMYVSLWDRLEQVHSQIDDKHSETCRAVFYSLVGDADVGTRKLQDTNWSLIAVADTTMRCYALNRRLDKFADAYSFILDA